MDTETEKLLDRALAALSGGERDAAAAIYKEYATKIRGQRPDIAGFYEHLLDDHPTANVITAADIAAKLQILSIDRAPSTGLIDEALKAYLAIEANEKKDTRISLLTEIIYQYGEAYRSVVASLRLEKLAGWSKAELLLDIVAKMDFCTKALTRLFREAARENK
jgi:hypothetical protein